MMTHRERERQRERWTGRPAADLDSEELIRAAAGGYEPGPDGYMTGRDPRAMSRDEIEAMGHEPMSPMQAIRAKCLDCAAGSPHEVRLCVAVACPSWPFRMGKNPWRAPASEAQIEQARKMAASRSEATSRNGLSAETVLDGVQ